MSWVSCVKKVVTCKQIRVIGRLSVIVEMRLVIMEDGEEIARNDYSEMYHQSSDWSEAEQLVQDICGLVFEGQETGGGEHGREAGGRMDDT